MTTTENDWLPTREDLLDWPPDGRRQAAGWDRLRRVCQELGLRVPTRAEVQVMESDLGELYLHAAERWNLLPEELGRLVICTRLNDGSAVLLQFAVGYVLEDASAPTQGSASTELGEA